MNQMLTVKLKSIANIAMLHAIDCSEAVEEITFIN